MQKLSKETGIVITEVQLKNNFTWCVFGGNMCLWSVSKLQNFKKVKTGKKKEATWTKG